MDHPMQSPSAAEAPPAPASRAVRPRNVGIDLVRCLALAAVVWGHMDFSLRPFTFSWHVPVFFLLSGYLWRQPSTGVAGEVVRRSRRVLVPYVAWLPIGLLATWLVLRYRDRPVSMHDLLLDGLHGGTSLIGITGPYYFLTAFATAVAVVLVTARFSWWLTIGVGVAATVAATLDPQELAGWPLSIGPGLVGTLLIAVGFGARRLSRRLRWRGVIGAALATLGLLGASQHLYDVVDLKKAYLGTPVVSLAVAVAIGIGLTWTCEVAAPLLPRAARRAVTAIAEVSVPVLMAHMLFGVLALLVHPGLAPAVRAVVAFTCAVATGLLIQRTPLRKILV